MRSASFLALLAGTGPALAVSRCVCRAKSVRRAVSALAAESATAFCSSLLAIEPETVTVPLSATVETTFVLTVTSTVTAPQTLTQVSSTTSTTTVLAGTTTSYPRAGGPLAKRTVEVPETLATLDPVVASKACLCYISAPPSPSTITVTTSHITTSTTTTTLVASTITTSPTVTTVTSTATSTSVEPTTVTVPGSLSFSLVQTFTDNCVPYNYQTLDFGLTMAGGTSFEGAFQWCAAMCASYEGCTQIWVAWTGGSSFDCMTGTTGSNGWDAGEIQCDYPPIHKDAYWFGVASS